MLGNKVKEIIINAALTNITLDKFATGIYCYQLENENKTLKKGKSNIE